MENDDLMNVLRNEVADQLMPKILAELTDEDRRKIREAAVARTIYFINNSAPTHTRLAEMAASELMEALRRSPAVIEEIKKVAATMAPTFIKHVEDSRKRIEQAVANRFDEMLRRFP